MALSKAISTLLLLLAAFSVVHAQTAQVNGPAKKPPAPVPPPGHWVDTWTSMPQLTEPANLPPPPFNKTNSVFANSTIRQTLHTSVGGSQFRVRISNNFGVTDLAISQASIALPASGAAGVSSIQLPTLKPITFSGNASIIIPNGALVVSDPVDLGVNVDPQSMVTVSLFLQQGQTTNDVTSHPGSRTTSWFSFGNFVNAEKMTDASLQSVAHWYFLTALEVWAPPTTSVFSIVGDSITDGRGSDDNKNNRWPDLVLAKMQKNAATANIAVVNQAAGGNRILADGLGPNALGRIDRDVLAHAGVKYAMIFEGVNDIGTAPPTVAAQQAVGDRLIQAFKQISTRVHTFGIPLFAATITPFSAPNSTIQPYSDPTREATRQRINTFIRTSGVFDAVIDFDEVLKNPEIPSQLNPNFNSGDFLHPNVAGYQQVADAFPLDIFDQFKNGVSGFN
ncbi:hypothetical protein JR316_0006615 [Psilocybe cubensis]|uniref:Uncharacterized protein n=2 Tax=Psilocybe cubensis TaxID=181762 RepID=A0ACB8GW91_PSICU|nr:hypothetical protein JR316_0006615 [Psilocybe cubensis]KAH9480018.1 hypothetical protein JR316_0006615 [Psilocybe cubensis]